MESNRFYSDKFEEKKEASQNKNIVVIGLDFSKWSLEFMAYKNDEVAKKALRMFTKINQAYQLAKKTEEGKRADCIVIAIREYAITDQGHAKSITQNDKKNIEIELHKIVQDKPDLIIDWGGTLVRKQLDLETLNGKRKLWEIRSLYRLHDTQRMLEERTKDAQLLAHEKEVNSHYQNQTRHQTQLTNKARIFAHDSKKEVVSKFFPFKETNNTARETEEDMIFKPAPIEHSSIVSVNGLNFSVKICCDHAHPEREEAVKNSKELAFTIVTSDTVDIYPENIGDCPLIKVDSRFGVEHFESRNPAGKKNNITVFRLDCFDDTDELKLEPIQSVYPIQFSIHNYIEQQIAENSLTDFADTIETDILKPIYRILKSATYDYSEMRKFINFLALNHHVIQSSFSTLNNLESLKLMNQFSEFIKELIIHLLDNYVIPNLKDPFEQQQINEFINSFIDQRKDVALIKQMIESVKSADPNICLSYLDFGINPFENIETKNSKERFTSVYIEAAKHRAVNLLDAFDQWLANKEPAEISKHEGEIENTTADVWVYSDDQSSSSEEEEEEEEQSQVQQQQPKC